VVNKGGIFMAANFKILSRRKNASLELKLAGDFDGTSACEVLNLVREKCQGGDKVFIHTSGLKQIYPFGQDTFQNNLHTLKNKRIRFVFTGKKAKQIAPERSKSCECYFADEAATKGRFDKDSLYPWGAFQAGKLMQVDAN
jgi:hypothetical protein